MLYQLFWGIKNFCIYTLTMSNLDKQIKSQKKEKFIIEFCRKRGWNPKEITTGQMLFITNSVEFKQLLKTL